MNIAAQSGFSIDPSPAYFRDVISTLKAENETLRERIIQLQQAYSAPEGLTRIANFAPIEEKALALLIAREMVTRESMYCHLYSNYDADEMPDDKILDVFICKIRQKISPLGCEIVTFRGRGWKLTPPSKARLLLMAGDVA